MSRAVTGADTRASASSEVALHFVNGSGVLSIMTELIAPTPDTLELAVATGHLRIHS